jgi:chromosome segregation ATPase
LNDVTAAKERADASWQEELRKERQRRESRETTNRELEERYSSELTNLATQLREKEDSLLARDGELTALRSEVKAISGRLNDMAATKERAEASWQEELRKERQQRESREAANRELEDCHAGELQNLANQLGEKDHALKGRDGELLALKTQLASLAEQLGKVESAKERGAALLQEKIKNEKQLREANDSAVKELEENFKGKIAVLEEQLSEKLQTMGSRDSQLQALTSELTVLNRRLSDIETAKEKAESLFSEAVREKEELAASKNASIRELEDDLSNKIRAFEARLNDREELLKGRDAELSAIKKQLTEIGAAKEQATRLLQDEIRKKSEELEEKESARKVLEEQLIGQLRTMESQLSEQRDQLGGRDAELAALTAKAGSLANQLTDASASKDQTTRSLHDEIRKKSEELEQREAHAKALEERFAERVRALESELSEQRERFTGREVELAGLTAKLGSLTNQLADAGNSKEETARLLQDEIRKRTAELEEREAHARALEERLTERARSLESDLSEQRQKLAKRETEVAGLTAKVASLTSQLSNVDASQDEAARLLQEDAREKAEQLRAKEAALKGLEERLSGSLRSLETQLGEKQELLDIRDSEVETLIAKVSSLAGQVAELESARARTERQLQDDLREKDALLETKNADLDDLEERLNRRLKTLERHLNDKQKLLEATSVEMGDMRAQMSVLEEQLKESENAKVWLENALHEERNKESQALIVADNRQPAVLGDGDEANENGESDGLDNIRTEREALLKARDKLINDLMGELKEKKSQLAKHEIEVWQGIERRGVWKHRLSKIGIRLKD